ncbi:MAG TPA: ATP-binding cassette domain-containing protein [Pirellulaceae bacterium]|nr:ATP-binding cassette domain-containing protein [Pirellulaceae bacterium]
MASDRRPSAPVTDELAQAADALHWLLVAAGRTEEHGVVLRALAEASASIVDLSDETKQPWGARFVDVADRFRVRVIPGSGTIRELMPLLLEGLPIAVRCPDEQSNAEWLVIDGFTGKGFHVRRSDRSAKPEIVSRTQLNKRLGGTSATIDWLAARPFLAGASTATGDPHGEGSESSVGPHGSGHGGSGHGGGHGSHGDHGHGHGEMAPLTRLLSLLRPERSDVLAIVVFSIVVGLLTIVTPLAVEAMVNTVAFGRNLSPVFVLALIVLTFLGFSAAIRALLTYMVEVIQRRLFVRLVEDLAYRLPRIQAETLRTTPLSEKLNQFFDIVSVQKIVASMLLEGLAIILQTFVGMAVLAFYHPFLLGFDIVLLASVTFVVLVLGRGAVRTAIKESKAKYSVAAWLEELVRHGTTFRLHAGRRLGLDRADDLTIGYLQARRRHFRIVIRQVIFALALQAVAATTLLALGGWLVISGTLSLGQLVAAELIVTVIVGSFAKLGKHLEAYYDLLASIDKLGGLLDLPISDEPQWSHIDTSGPVGVTVSHGNFRDARDSHASHSDRLEISSGETVALVGVPGSGKSRLLEALAGLTDPHPWSMQLRDIDVREIRRDVLDELVGVAFEIEIFRGTIGENIDLGRPDVRQIDIRRALEAVELGREIDSLPLGLETPLLTDGHPLSRTQKARLMLARALAGRPRLLLIDGLLDMLPDEQAERILTRLADPSEGRTIVFATGRACLLQKADRITELTQLAAADH